MSEQGTSERRMSFRWRLSKKVKSNPAPGCGLPPKSKSATAPCLAHHQAKGSPDTLSMNECSDEETLSLSHDEIDFLKYSWDRAVNSVDVGGELIIRLLNDKRSLFRQLVEAHYEILETDLFTVEKINSECPRAKEVGEGVVRFIHRLFQRFEDNIVPVAEICQMCMDLGALHYRKRVWFQAENWLCVKNSLLEVILVLGNKPTPSGLISMCVGGQAQPKFFLDSNAQRAAWTKMIQFIIRHMKRGFLAEALRTDEQKRNAAQFSNSS